MSREFLCSILVILSSLALLTGCGSNPSQKPMVSITATKGSGQESLTSAAFASPLAAKVTTGGTPTAGVKVTFTAPSFGATGAFANGTATETVMTDFSGIATSSTLTANATEGSYSVSATVAGATTSATFDLRNATATFFSFYLNGLETIDNSGNLPSYYALAGSVAIDSSGNVVSGEQDYNDGFHVTSPQPGGDFILSGTLAVDANGQGTLTLITNNAALGSAGTETLGIQFVNANHALITQFDGSATSSGSLDLQTLPSAMSGGYAFTFSGVDSNYEAVAFGGVFSISGGTVTGKVDVNDAGIVTRADDLNGTVTTPDRFGRGQITGVSVNGILLSLNYYLVSPEAIRIIDVDDIDSAVGSAFGQGSNATAAGNGSLGKSVFGVEDNSWGSIYYAAAGILVPRAGSGTFTGVADNDEESTIAAAATISGTYSIASNGYGSLTITNAGLLDVTSFGLYATDPSLNLLDPNNTSGGGGVLLVSLDSGLEGGVGLAIPQTDTVTNSFKGSYAFGAQVYESAFLSGATGWEFDYIGLGSVSSGALTGTGAVNDTFGFFSSTSNLYNAAPFAGAITADTANPGRYTMVPLNITVGSESPTPFSMAIYQARGSALFWINEDSNSLSFGTLQQEPTAVRVGRNAKTEFRFNTRARAKR